MRWVLFFAFSVREGFLCFGRGGVWCGMVWCGVLWCDVVWLWIVRVVPRCWGTVVMICYAVLYFAILCSSSISSHLIFLYQIDSSCLIACYLPHTHSLTTSTYVCLNLNCD